MTEREPDAVVFDLDGTLVHSAPDIHAAVNRMLAGVGQDPLSLKTVTGMIGNGMPTLVRRVMDHCGLPPERHPELAAATLAHYSAHPADLTHPYPGVVACLEALQAADVRLGVCTNKPEAPAVEILKILGLTDFFSVVVGGDSLPVKKPDPAPLHTVFEALGGRPALYVGDSEVDAETAVRAGLRFALFTGGYRRSPVSDIPHDMAFDDYAALPGLLGADLPPS